MFQEIAIDPRCMSQFEYYSILKMHFGYENRRYAVADVKKWAIEAVKHAKSSDNIAPVRKKSVTNFLNRVLRGREKGIFLVTDERKKLTADDWETWLQLQTELRPFSLTLSENNEGCLVYEQIIEGHPDWELPLSISINKRSTEIVAAIKPLIHISKNLVLIDQFFRFASNESLNKLVEFLNETEITSLTIVSSMTTHKIEEQFNNIIRPLITGTLKFVWIKAEEKFFHDRYILGEAGAIRSGQGYMQDIEKGTQADKLNLNAISHDEADRTKSELDKAINDGKAVILMEQYVSVS